MTGVEGVGKRGADDGGAADSRAVADDSAVDDGAVADGRPVADDSAVDGGAVDDGAEMDRTFARYQADVVCYGHDHMAADVTGRARYVSPGSLGCCREALARFLVLECAHGEFAVHARAVPYDDAPLFAAFEARQVPERAFLYRAFFGGRYG